MGVALVLLMPGQAHAYIGPGAGFALAGSFFAVFAAIGVRPADVHHLAGAAAEAHPLRLARVPAQPLQARRHPRARRHGPRPDRDDARRGQAPAPGQAARAGLLQAAGHHGAAALAGRLVDVSDRGQPRQAQHLRLPHPGPAHLPRQAQLGRDPPAAPVDPAGQVPDSPGQGRRAAAAQESAVLEHPEQARHLQLRSARADHVPAREAVGRAALGDVRPRPARHAGDVLATTRPGSATKAKRSAARSTTSPATATPSAPTWSARKTRSAADRASCGCRSR